MDEAGNLTAEQEEDIREAFDLFDDNCNGTLRPRDLRAASRLLLGPGPDREEIETTLQQFDEDQSGDLSLDEFTKTMLQYTDAPEEEIKQAFNKFDENSSGTLSPPELRKVMKFILGPKLGSKEASNADDIAFAEYRQMLVCIFKRRRGDEQAFPKAIDTVPAYMSGILFKRGPAVGMSWMKRWCVLCPDKLYYYENKKCSEVKGAVDISGAARAFPFSNKAAPGDAIKHASEKPHGMVVDQNPAAGKKRQLFYFDAGDQEELLKWQCAIKRTVGNLMGDSENGRETSASTRLFLTIFRASGLRKGDANGTSDPYCLCKLVGKASEKVRTETVKKTLEPQWNESCIMHDYAEGDMLYFAVMDADPKLPQDDFLGKATLSSEYFHKAGFVGSLPLLDTSGFRSQIYVGVQVLSCAASPPAALADPNLADAERLESDRLSSIKVCFSYNVGQADYIRQGMDLLKNSYDFTDANFYCSPEPAKASSKDANVQWAQAASAAVTNVCFVDSQYLDSHSSCREFMCAAECNTQIVVLRDELARVKGQARTKSNEPLITFFKIESQFVDDTDGAKYTQVFDLIARSTQLRESSAAARRSGPKRVGDPAAFHKALAEQDGAVKSKGLAVAGAEAAPLTADVLKAQNDKTSAAIIQLLKDDPAFQNFAKQELDGIVKRDAEDAEKLAAGVQQAIDKDVLPKDLTPQAYENVDVMGKTAGQVADEIIAKLPKEGGCVMILCGLSGTGKGTTVDTLKAKLPNASTWSNGNCFRSLTLLAATHCEQAGMTDFDPACLTPENLATWTGMLEFGKFDGVWDIRINGLGIDARVSEIANTKLKEPNVSKNIPTVAKETQGEVVKFAGQAAKQMGDDGMVVLVEGREQTLNFISSPYRFCLMMSDMTVIGARRAAQRIGASALKKFENGSEQRALEEIVREAFAEVVAEVRS